MYSLWSQEKPYHPIPPDEDGLVERINRSLLTLLRSFVDREEDWEKHLQLLLFIYRNTKHATTGLPPYEVLFGCNLSILRIPNLPDPVVPDPAEYSATLKRKLYVLRELVEANTVHSAERQQFFYNSSTPPQLKAGQQVLLNNPSKQKLSPRWIGPWNVLRMKGPTSVELKLGATNRTIHINRVPPLLLEEDEDHPAHPDWTPPLFDHEELPLHSSQPLLASGEAADLPVSEPPAESPYVTRSGRVVKPVQRYGMWS